MKKSIGIDLGTTNSVVAVKKVSTEVLKNAEGEYTTPSCVLMKKRLMRRPEFIVGRDALEWMRQDPEHAITAVKRLVGRNFHEKEIQDLISRQGLSYRLSSHSQGSANSLAVQLGGKEFTPEELSSKILAKLKADAEAALGDEVEAAVITVPAYFNDKQKHATRKQLPWPDSRSVVFCQSPQRQRFLSEWIRFPVMTGEPCWSLTLAAAPWIFPFLLSAVICGWAVKILINC
ncbi:MAG: Hsp70 family protein [Candidatus Electrothrix sp. ATG1]|nr:Hsp70 family protein [Candidatus Electrothrix sp. ATG1]